MMPSLQNIPEAAAGAGSGRPRGISRRAVPVSIPSVADVPWREPHPDRLLGSIQEITTFDLTTLLAAFRRPEVLP